MKLTHLWDARVVKLSIVKMLMHLMHLSIKKETGNGIVKHKVRWTMDMGHGNIMWIKYDDTKTFTASC